MRLFAKTRARNLARATYWEFDTRLNGLHRQLGHTTDARERSVLLFRLARTQLGQAEVHDAAFGIDVLNEDDAASTMAQSMRWSACLYRLLGDVEKAVGYPGHGRRERMSAILGETSDGVLDRMAETPDLADRRALLGALYEAVIGKVGGQAAETVACLPYPRRAETAR